jgi:hypothetical protein
VTDYKKPAKIDGAYVESFAYSIYTNNYISSFYKEQLNKFKKIGLGKQTEYGIEITSRLIKATERRLMELKPMTSLRTNKKEEKWRV